MKVLVLGGTGMLGEALMERCRSRNLEAIAAARGSKTLPLDIADRRQLESALFDLKPDVVINCAALASIDACESDPAKAFALNTEPAGELARLSGALRFKLVHV